MNGMAYGIGGFVSGLVEGAEIRNRWGDRKRRQKLEDEDRALAKEDRALRLEDRQRRIAMEDERLGWARADRVFQQEEREREESLRRSISGGVDSARKKVEANKDANAVSRSQVDEPPAAVPPGATAAADPIPRRIERSASTAPTAQTPPARTEGVIVPPAPDSSAGQRQPYGISRAGRGRVYTNPPERAAQPGMALMPGEGVAGAPGIAPRTPDQATQPANAQPALPAPVPPANAPAPQSAEIAVSTARSISGTRSKKEASEDFMEVFTTEFVPSIEQDFIAAGDLDGLKVFKTWIGDETTQQGVRDFGTMMRSAALGDTDGFFKAAEKVINSPYIDDNVSMIGEKSGLIKGEDGSITGAFITMRDESTGEETRMQFDSLQELYAAAVYWAAPEEVLKRATAEIAAAEEVRKGNLEHQRDIEIEREKARLRGEGQAKTPQQQIDAEIEELRRTDFSFASLPVEEQTAKAIASLEAKRAAAESFGAVQRGVVAARGE